MILTQSGILMLQPLGPNTGNDSCKLSSNLIQYHDSINHVSLPNCHFPPECPVLTTKDTNIAQEPYCDVFCLVIFINYAQTYIISCIYRIQCDTSVKSLVLILIYKTSM